VANLEEKINQAIADFNDIEKAIEESGVDVPYDTDTSQYGALIREGVVPKAYEAGQKAEYDKFWDNFQDYGNRTNYTNAFRGGYGFNNQNLYPKYDICLVGSVTYMFYGWSGYSENVRKINFKERMTECGVVLDTSQATNLSYTFAYFYASELPTIDLIGLKETSTLIFGDNYEYLKSIEKIIISETTPISTSWFRSDTGLENLTIEGTIGQNGFNVQWSTKLTHDSLMSIINALADKSADTSGTTWKVTLGTTNIAKLTQEECDIASNKGWYLE
jgi:hypothetical protein